jgi:hypothetical protein
MKQVLDSYNAKHLKDDEILKSFVSSFLFIETAKNMHTVLVGPRGSGKTTFLRMLSNKTLPMWPKYESFRDVGEISYQGIYVPGDLVWGEMLNSLSTAGLPKKYSEVFSYSAFVSHVLISSIEAIETYLNLQDPALIESKEEEIYEALESIGQTLKLSLKKISISRIKQQLKSNLASLFEYSRYLSLVGGDGFDEAEFLLKVPYAYSELKFMLENVFDSIDGALNKSEQRWALLCDEFEIAPSYLLEKIISHMRSSSQKIIFKVALVPCGSHQELRNQSSSINDYSVVELWYVRKGESKKFCEKLIKSRFDIENPVSILGPTKYGVSSKNNKEQWVDVFEELAKKDKSFKSFLISKGIEPRKIFNLEGAMDSLIRKISPLVAFRNAFLNSSGNRKGRKSLAEFYSGWEGITTISEGNPRWLLSVLSFIVYAKQSSRLMTSVQMKQVDKATNAYCAMLKTLPLSNNMGLSTKQPVYELLEKIGKYFNRRLIDDDFMVSPPSTFIVDKHVSKEVESALMIAWNYGAIVSISTDTSFGNYENIIGMRFRLSHLLAPRFELVLTTGPSINLTTILNNDTSKSKSPSDSGEVSFQKDFFK